MKQTRLMIVLMRLAMACSFLAICHQTHAQTTEEWKEMAIKKYPTLNLKGSALNTKFLAAYTERLKSDPDFIKKPDWMMKLADELAPKRPKPDNTPEKSPVQPTVEPPVQPIIPPVVKEGSYDDAPVPFNFKIEDTVEFFDDFIEKGSPKDSDQFMTREENEARLPKTVHYFKIADGSNFSYDADLQKMTYCAGYLHIFSGSSLF